MKTKKLSSEPDGTIVKVVGIDVNGSVVKQSYSGWSPITFNLTQADVRALGTANGGYGFKMFNSPGALKSIQIANPMIIFTGQVQFLTPVEIYSHDTITDISIANFNNTAQPVSANHPISFTNIKNGNAIDILYPINEAIYIYNADDNSTFVGTGKLIMDYRILDFS